jgi:hypothetical protein
MMSDDQWLLADGRSIPRTTSWLCRSTRGVICSSFPPPLGAITETIGTVLGAIVTLTWRQGTVETIRRLS